MFKWNAPYGWGRATLKRRAFKREILTDDGDMPARRPSGQSEPRRVSAVEVATSRTPSSFGRQRAVATRPTPQKRAKNGRLFRNSVPQVPKERTWLVTMDDDEPMLVALNPEFRGKNRNCNWYAIRTLSRKRPKPRAPPPTD